MATAAATSSKDQLLLASGVVVFASAAILLGTIYGEQSVQRHEASRLQPPDGEARMVFVGGDDDGEDEDEDDDEDEDEQWEVREIPVPPAEEDLAALGDEVDVTLVGDDEGMSIDEEGMTLVTEDWFAEDGQTMVDGDAAIGDEEAMIEGDVAIGEEVQDVLPEDEPQIYELYLPGVTLPEGVYYPAQYPGISPPMGAYYPQEIPGVSLPPGAYYPPAPDMDGHTGTGPDPVFLPIIPEPPVVPQPYIPAPPTAFPPRIVRP